MSSGALRTFIVGAGAVGYHLASRLAAEGHEITIIDPDPMKVRHVEDNLDALAIEGTGAAPTVLRDAGLEGADILAAVSGIDEVNLLACQIASRMDVRFKVARLRHPEHFPEDGGLTPRDLGADLMISPETECAWEIYQLLNSPAATDLAGFAEGRVQLVGMRIKPESPMAGVSLADLARAHRRHPFVVAAVVHDEQTTVPTGSTVLEAGDKVFVLAETREARRLPRLAGYEPQPLRRVIIAGGSTEAVHLARHFEEHRVQCILLERDRDRARYLAELLPRALVLEGDATDLELLEAEGVEGIDGFVALTDRDEVNMLISLLAKNANARRVIPLVHKPEYAVLAERVGLDGAVSPRISAANAILSFIRRGRVSSVATLKGNAAEALEVVIDESAELIGRSLRDIDFPTGALLGVLVRDGRVILPGGEDTVEAGDHAIFFVLPDARSKLERLI